MPERYVQLPNGQYLEWPEGVSASEFKAKAARVMGEQPAPPSLLERGLRGAGDVGLGLLKGAGSTAEGVGHLLFPDAAARALGMTPPTPEQARGYFAPANAAQALGKGLEQTGEFLLPGLGEEKALSLLPKAEKGASLLARAVRPLGRIAYQGATGGALNAAQGGGVGTGVAAGLLGGAGGEAMRAAAPGLAESGLGIRLLQRGGGRTGGKIGRAMLEETSGLSPEAVAESAKGRIGSLYGQRQRVLQAASERPALLGTEPAATASMAAPRKIYSQAMQRTGPLSSGGTSEPTLRGELGKMADYLSREGGEPEGLSIPDAVTPEYMGRLQQGFSGEHLRPAWNPNPLLRGSKEANAIGREAYGAMTGELERVAPESAVLNRRIANLIPVEEGARMRMLGTPLAQRVMGRIGARTGALVLGGGVGYKEGGLPGAVAGAGLGALAPELAWGPAGQIAAARLLYRAAPKYLAPAAVGAGLNLFGRPTPEQ